MPEFQTGDIVRVEMPRGYSGRGILGISLLFSTSPESRFEGAIGTVTEINPVGPQMVHQYLVDFRTHDNSRIGIPWQAQWFREEWLALKERPEASTAKAAQDTPDATWPDRPEDAAAAAGGIAHPGAKIFSEGRKDFAPPGVDPATATGTVPDAAYGIGPSASKTDDAASASKSRDVSAPGQDAAATGTASNGSIVERGDTYVRVQGMQDCPEDFPIKGNESSGIHHVPAVSSYARTIPEICFASEDAALGAGYRAPRGRVVAAESVTVVESGMTPAGDFFTQEATIESIAIAPEEEMTARAGTGSGVTSESSATSGEGSTMSRGDGFVQVDGMQQCPDGYPIKGNASSGIYHVPGSASYERTIPEICFESIDIATANGFRAARGSAAPETADNTAPEQSNAFTGVDRQDDRSGLDATAFAPAESEMGIAAAPASSDLITERGEGFVKVQGMSVCPDGFPIKGNANSGIFHSPTDSSYARTIPEICFATEDVAAANGFRPPARRG